MIRAADLLAEGRRIPGLAGSAQVTADWAPVAERIRKEATDGWDDTAAAERFTGKGGRLARGRGRITAPGEVTVASPGGAPPRVFRASRGIVLNTGTEPAAPPIDGLDGTPYWTNRDAVETEQVPGSLIALGGGAIGSELAQAFARFGAEVTVIEAAPRLLPMDEPEAGALLAKVFAADGIAVHTGVAAAQVSHDGNRFTVQAGGQAMTAGRLLVATGRRNCTAGLGLDVVGLDPTARAVEVDARMRAADGVWAIGDITGHGAFTHMSMYQAEIARRDILGEDGPAADYRAVPRVTFTDPEIGAVGLTEAQAREQGLEVRTGTTQIPDSARGWIHKAGNDGFIKVIEDARRGVLVGATSAGPAGGEVLSALAVAVRGEVPVATLRNMPYAYPTFHRAIETALADLATP
jgi:pyruvate/2-oxoglutarate dehydrogenase complex dihydrolipoamide dehydrogenase (E3) component